jgi:hypothetical protein
MARPGKSANLAIMYVPTREEFLQGIEAFNTREPRAAVYYEALDQLRQEWNKVKLMAAAIASLLTGWHMGFYRFGMFDCGRLEECLREQMPILDSLRGRGIQTLEASDETIIQDLFAAFLTALRGGKGGVQKSPVATAKALHLLAPNFLPLWDNSIAFHYGHILMFQPDYVSFCWEMKELAEKLMSFFDPSDNATVLKRIDEFNYAAYAKLWISTSAPFPRVTPPESC